MTTDDLFMQAVIKSVLITIAINCVLILFFGLLDIKKKNKQRIYTIIRIMFGNTMIFFVIMCMALFGKVKVREETVVKDPEIITDIQIVEVENMIEIPSIMLPLQPEGREAIVIDTTSNAMQYFMADFYGENVYFFNNRQNATFVLTDSGSSNYTGLSIEDISYQDANDVISFDFDDLGYDTVWFFSDLSHINMEETNSRVIMYVPYQLSSESIESIKEKGDITIITIDTIS